MDITQLQHFKTVAGLQHMTRAAEELNVSQPALSQSIIRLEEELGVQLFERKGRNIQLNEYGRAFLPTAEQILAAVDDGKLLLKSMRQKNSNLVSIIALTLWGFPNLEEHIKDDEDCKNVNLSVYSCPVNQVISKLKNGDADFCLMTIDFDDPDLESRLVHWHEMGVLVRNDHPLAGKTVSLDAFRDETFVAFVGGTAPRMNFNALFSQIEWRPNVTTEVDNYSDIVRAVCTGKYIATTVSAIHENYNYTNQRLSFVHLLQPERKVGLKLYWLRNHKQKPIVRAVKNSIAKYFLEFERR